VLEEGRKNERSEILEKLTKGMRLKGAVSSIVDFGAFVDLGGIDGLVHISELSWNHVNHPSEVVKVGDEVEVEVLEVDLNRERISLGLKQTTEDPWRALVKNYPISSILEGKVTKLVNFGAFVELGENIEGLVHISEMSPKHIVAPAQVVKVGDNVHVKVIDIDPDRRRVSLSMKQAAETLGIEIEVAEPDPSMAKPTKGKKSDDDSESTDDEATEVGYVAAETEAESEVAEVAGVAVEEIVEEAIIEAVIEEAVVEAVAEEIVAEAIEEVVEEAVVAEAVAEVVEEAAEASEPEEA
jgi:small subunit ribosomal protein S1